MQFSIELKPNKAMPSFAQVKHAIVPFAWLEESSNLKGKELRNLITMDILRRYTKSALLITITSNASMLTKFVF